MTVEDHSGLTGMAPNVQVMVNIDRQEFVELLAKALAFYH